MKSNLKLNYIRFSSGILFDDRTDAKTYAEMEKEAEAAFKQNEIALKEFFNN